MNYSLCSQEKIEIPGKIQSFGYIIGIDTSFKIQFYSENIYSLFNINENILDKSIQYIPLISDWLKTININESINITAELFNINSCLHYIDLKFYNNQYHISLEKIVKTENITGSRILEIDHYENIINYEDLWNNLLQDIHHKIGYDRMMIYQFLEDGSGKVIAEKKISSVESFLNLHYPKNDIPEQAKNLYLKQKRRIFSNVNSKEILLVSKHKNIDLSYFDSRSMSSIHRQYLINTNIESSFSTSIIIDGKLWGLVTCQNNNYKHIDLRDRIYSELLTNCVSKSYSILRSKNRNDYNLKIDKEIFEIKKNISFCDDINIGIKDNLNNFIDLVEADGAVFVNDDKILKKGHTPSNVKILDIINWYKNNFINENEIHIDRSFAFKNPNLVDDLKETAGIVINEINREQKK